MRMTRRWSYDIGFLHIIHLRHILLIMRLHVPTLHIVQLIPRCNVEEANLQDRGAWCTFLYTVCVRRQRANQHIRLRGRAKRLALWHSWDGFWGVWAFELWVFLDRWDSLYYLNIHFGIIWYFGAWYRSSRRPALKLFAFTDLSSLWFSEDPSLLENNLKSCVMFTLLLWILNCNHLHLHTM